MPFDPCHVGRYVQINVPEWFARKDFMAWLNNPESGVATWHTLGKPACEGSDVFMTFDHGDGSEFEADGFPADIVQMIKENFVEEGHLLLWLTNFQA